MIIEKERVVSIEYSLKDTEGTVIDSSENSGAFTYIHGMAQTLPGIEEVLNGKEAGFTYEGTIPAEKAYGEKSDDYHIPVPRSEFPEGDTLKAGMFITIVNNYEEEQEMEIISVDDENIVIDANSPYAGKDVLFTCNVLEVREATEEEIEEATHSCGCGCGDDCDCDGDCDCGDDCGCH